MIFVCADVESGFKAIKVRKEWRKGASVIDFIVTDDEVEFLSFIEKNPVLTFIPGDLVTVWSVFVPIGGKEGHMSLKVEFEEAKDIWVPRKGGTSFVVDFDDYSPPFKSKVIEYKPTCLLWLRTKEETAGFVEVLGDKVNLGFVGEKDGYENGKIVAECLSVFTDNPSKIIVMVARTFETKVGRNIDKIYVFGDHASEIVVPEFNVKILKASEILPFERELSEKEDISLTSLVSLIRRKPDSVYPIFNFAASEIRRWQDILSEFSKLAMIPSWLVFISSLMFMVSAGIRKSEVERSLEVEKNEMREIFTQTFPSVKKIVDPYLQMKAEVDRTLGIKKRPILEIMSEFTKSVSQNVTTIEELMIDEKTLRFQGQTQDLESVDKIRTVLEKVFDEVKITSTRRAEEGGFEFRMVMKR